MKTQRLFYVPLLFFLSQVCFAQEVQVSTYPECIQPGDTFYVKVTFVNHSDDSYILSDSSLFFGIAETKWRALSRNGNVYEWLPEVGYYRHSDGGPRIIQYFYPPKTQLCLLLQKFQFPPLDELHSEFWEHEMEALKNAPEGLDYEFEIVIIRPLSELPQVKASGIELFSEEYRLLDKEGREKRFKEVWEEWILRLKTNVKIKLRPPDEMALIEQWYKNTPASLWPTNLRNTLSKAPYKELGRNQWSARVLGPAYKPRDSKWILIQEKWYSPWLFIRLGNRYPSDPNAPETWQGWKELEESISPSTMRDEIRLTRILIQYCDTRDEKVLDELKEWFADMNEVQRACMAISVIGHLEEDSVLSVPSRDLINVVREYAISDKPRVEVK